MDDRSFNEMQQYVADQMKELEARMKVNLQTAVDNLRREIRGEITAKVDSKMSTALISVETKQQLTRDVSKVVQKEVYQFLNKEIIPKLDAAVAQVEYNTQDGDSLVMAYRKQLDVVANKRDDNVRRITGRAEDAKSAFQREHLFFNGDD